MPLRSLTVIVLLGTSPALWGCAGAGWNRRAATQGLSASYTPCLDPVELGAPGWADAPGAAAGLSGSDGRPAGQVGHEVMAAQYEAPPALPRIGAFPSPSLAVPSPETAAAEELYRRLDPHECQCLAAQNSLLGNLLDAEGRTSGAAGGRPGRKQAANDALRRGVLAARAAHQRNTSAGDALELFYLLAEAEAGRESLGASLAEIDRAIANLRELRARGLKVEADEGKLARQRLDLLEQQADLELSIRQLNSQLKSLTGIDSQSQTDIWPVADLEVDTAPVDADEAVAAGLTHRADLEALRRLRGSLSADTLPIVRAALGGVNPLLGGKPVACSLLAALGCSRSKSSEVASRQGQVDQLLAYQERAVVTEVRQAVETLNARSRELTLAKQISNSRQQDLKRLEQRREADGVTAFDLLAARLALIESESDQVHRAMAWKIARARLKQAQGLLAVECGY
jgi:hypothetical protein